MAKRKIYYTITDNLGRHHDCFIVFNREYSDDDILLDLHWRKYHQTCKRDQIINHKYVVDIRIKRRVYCD